MAKWPDFYKDVICTRMGCESPVCYVFLMGEADIPVCESHFTLALEELGCNYIAVAKEGASV